MATEQRTVDYLVEQLRGAKAIAVRKMFGEYAVYRDGKLVALVCDDQLYVIPTGIGRALAQDCNEAPPYPGAKPHLLIAAYRWENADWLAELIEVSAAALPERRSRQDPST